MHFSMAGYHGGYHAAGATVLCRCGQCNVLVNGSKQLVVGKLWVPSNPSSLSLRARHDRGTGSSPQSEMEQIPPALVCPGETQSQRTPDRAVILATSSSSDAQHLWCKFLGACSGETAKDLVPS